VPGVQGQVWPNTVQIPQTPSKTPIDEDTVNIYWCADCKTPGCKQRQVFKQVEFTSDPSDDPTIRLDFPARFTLRCKTCGTIHSYTMADVEDFQSEESLPLGFESQL
jgi:hypothetical protein